MSLMAVNEESDPSAILNGFWVTLFVCMRVRLCQSLWVMRGASCFISSGFATMTDTLRS